MDDVIPEGLTEGALALLVLDRVFAFVRGMRGKANGHAEVRPQDALQFWELQSRLERKLDTLIRERGLPPVD